jgi:hypothetical protein
MMDEDQKGCIVLGMVFLFLALCVIVALICGVVVTAHFAGEVAKQALTTLGQSLQVLEFLLTCIIELVKYSLTPFMPFIKAITPRRQ